MHASVATYNRTRYNNYEHLILILLGEDCNNDNVIIKDLL